MKRYIIAAAAIAFLACPCVGLASYVIQLKNGNQLVVPQYWEEGDAIKFRLRGGMISLSKDSVRKITASHLVYRERPNAAQETTVESSPEGVSLIPFSKPAEILGRANSPQVKKPTQKDGKNEAKGLAYFKEQREKLRAEMDEAREKFWTASGSEDSETKRKAAQDIARISNQLTELTDELRRKNACELPDWWKGD